MTVTDLITQSALMGGIVALGETPEGPLIDYGLGKLNDMVDMWAADRLAIFRTQRSAGQPLVAGTQTYTLGPGGDWNLARPSWIEGAGIIEDPSATYPIELGIDVLTTKQYKQVLSKTIQSQLPFAIWYDHTFGATGRGTVYVYPIPASSTPQIILYLPTAVSEFATGDTVSVPPGYRMALVSNLAVLMCLGLRPLPENVGELAVMSFGRLKAVNLVTQMDPLDCDDAVLQTYQGQFNYFDGGFNG